MARQKKIEKWRGGSLNSNCDMLKTLSGIYKNDMSKQRIQIGVAGWPSGLGPGILAEEIPCQRLWA
jgi:hypothetical protein